MLISILGAGFAIGSKLNEPYIYAFEDVGCVSGWARSQANVNMRDLHKAPQDITKVTLRDFGMSENMYNACLEWCSLYLNNVPRQQSSERKHR